MSSNEPSTELATGALADSEPSPAKSRPQLRLHHFFALTAVAAVLLALNGPQQDHWTGSQFEPPRLIQTLFVALGVLYVLLLAVAITALAYGIVWQRMGMESFNQPGHWLVVAIAVTGLFATVPTIIFRSLYSSVNFEVEFPMLAMVLMGIYSLIAVVALPLGLNIYIGLKKCREKRWSLIFYMKAVDYLLFGLGSIVIIALLIIAVRRDRREQIPRDLSHWCGVSLQLAHSGLTCLSVIVSVANMYYMFNQM